MVDKKKSIKKKVAKKVTKKVAKKKAVKKRVPPQAKWNPEYLPIIKRLFLNGKIATEVAFILGICEKTYYNWKDNYFDEETLQSIKAAKDESDEDVVIKLRERAKGYIAREDKAFLTKTGRIKTVKMIKEYPPETAAIKYYLGNRQPDKWKDKNEEVKKHDRADQKFSFNLDDEAKEI